MGTTSYEQYVEANLRFEVLPKEVDHTTPKCSPLSKALIEVSDTIEPHEEIHLPK